MEYKVKQVIKKLGKRLRSLRMSKHISLNKLAYENDLTTATISRIENGLVDLRMSTLLKVAISLEMPIEEIIKPLEIDYTQDYLE